jgi:hypothetical protein
VLQDRYDRTGELADLDEAINAYRRAAGARPADRAQLSQIRGNLGTALADRYEVGEEAPASTMRSRISGTEPPAPAAKLRTARYSPGQPRNSTPAAASGNR